MSLISGLAQARLLIAVVAPILFIIVSGGGVIAQVGPVSTASGGAATLPIVRGLAESAAPIQVALVAGRSTVIDVGAPIARVSLTSADVADALVTTPSQLLVNGKMPGTISMFVWERGGALRLYEIKVQRDIDVLATQLKELFPGESIEARSNGTNIVLSGRVSTKAVAERAVSVASGFVANKESVVSLLAVQQAPRVAQVLLRVRFAEVSRSAITELGVSFFTSPTGIKNTVGRLTTQQFDAPRFEELGWTKQSGDFGSPVTSAEGKLTFGDFLNLFLLSEKFDLGMMIKALSSRGLFQTLAEPNLVAESGKEASFLAGGEFPVPVAQGGTNNAISVQFKEFGVRLNFTPTVNGDRVHLKVRPEVSTLDFANGVVLQGFRIPALSTRRTETELELRDGQTFAIAGLMDSSMASTLQKIPGIGDIPILGRLFQSKAARKDRTELVVMITPEILRDDSPGVTNALPRIAEPYLEPLPENRTMPQPAPAFGGPGSTGSVAPASAPVAQATAVAPAAGAAQTTPANGGTVAQSAVAASVAAAAAPGPRVMTAQERKAEERARREAEERAEREARAEADAQKAAEKAAARDAEAERKRVAEEQKHAKAAAEEQARRDQAAAEDQARRDAAAAKQAAEDAKRAAEAAKRQDEAERKRQKAIAEAEMRLKAAQVAYEQERAGSARP
jgi:pilus assembly protein CpaC